MSETVDSSATELPDLATREEVAKYLRVSVPTLARWAMDRVGPPYVRLGLRAVRYRREDIQEWVNAQGGAR